MRRIIISAVIVLVLAGGILALFLWPEAPPPETSEDPSLDENTGNLIEKELEEVSQVWVFPRDGTPFSILRDPESGLYELVAPEAVLPGNPDTMHFLFSAASSLTDLQRVAENADDEQLATFEFDNPILKWRTDLTDGTSVEFEIGGLPSGGGGRYVRQSNSREVFLLDWKEASLAVTLEEVYDLHFVPLTDSGVRIDPLLISHVLLERAQDVIELRSRSEEERSLLETGASAYQIIQPAVAEASDDAVKQHILSPIVNLVPDSVETPLPADLSLYGLDSPTRLTVTLDDGWSGTLLIGRYDSARNGMYVMIEGADAVLFHNSAEYSFLRIAYSQLRSSILWIRNINTVSSITYDLEGDVRVLRFEDGGKSAWLNEETINADNAARLFTSTLLLTHDGGTDAEIPQGKPAYRFSMDLIEGKSDTIELYPLNDTQYLIVRNGVNEKLYITRMTLDHIILSRFAILDRGEDLPPR